MNRQKSTTGIQRMFDGIYMEAMRRGGFVTFVVMAIISAGLGYLIYGYLLRGWVDSGREYQRQVAAKELENRKTEAMLEGETQFRAQFAKVTGLYEDAKPLLPKETEIADVLGQVEMAARRNNVTLTGLLAVKESVKSPRAAKLYEREMPAVVTGSYPQVVKFFGDISRMPRILLVRDYSIVSLKGSVSAGFTLVAYHAPPPAELPNGPKDVAVNEGRVEK